MLIVNSERMRQSFEALAALGATPGGGVHRPAFGQAHARARQWFRDQGMAMGLPTQVDPAGNHSLVLPCGPSGAPHLLIGSHLDSVPQGGRFDGALGVAAALEVMRVVQERGIPLPVHLEAMDFSDEEGAFVGLMGSRALAGILPVEELDHPATDLDHFRQALEAAGLQRNAILKARRPAETVAGYLELHIEQGRRLTDSQIAIGVVTGFVGIRGFKLIFKGRADHAGTTPMDLRQDAGAGACAWATTVRNYIMKNFPEGVATIGNMTFHPGAFNVVPEQVEAWLEFRGTRERDLDAMETGLLNLAQQTAAGSHLSLTIVPVEQTHPIQTDGDFRRAIRKAATTLGLSSQEMPSGAGHDAQALAALCPSGMIFVPSRDGASHSHREFTPWEQCVQGANVLLHTILEIHGQGAKNES